MANTITYFVDGTTTHETLGGQMGVSRNRLDFTEKNCVATDIVQALKIPANCTVKDVDVRIVTAQGATATATVGDGSGANSWDASTNLNATAGTNTSSLKGTDAYAYGKYYAAADTIDLVLGHTVDTAVIEITATYFHGLLA